MANLKVPKNTVELFDIILDIARDEFGFKDKENGILRDCIHKKDSSSELSATEGNFWFGFVREGQGNSGGYEGLSYVVFPEKDGSHCLVSLGIGSQSVSTDSELAASPQLRRSFSKLTKDAAKCDAHFFFKLRFDEMEEETPGLKKHMEETDYDKYMQTTTELYNTGNHHGKLPAVMVVNFATKEGIALIIAWLAQYASWRNWSSFKNGKDKPRQKKAIDDAIKACSVSVSCPTQEEVKEILIERRFIVLQGAPGCGKTYTAKNIANDSDFRGRTSFIQFHAETNYSDFVYGIKPILNGQAIAYRGEKGILLQILDKALAAEKQQSNEKFLLIIDEFNRANLANVLGPVFYLFEQNADKTGNIKLNLGNWVDPSGKETKLEYDHIPDNLYVIATMNTADKSLAVVDFALRRRFSWITLRPHSLKDVVEGFDEELFNEVERLFACYATDEELNLQPGQSYFMDREKRQGSIVYGLMPLMKEYFNWGYMTAAKEEFAQLFYKETGKLMYE